ncbi:putative mitochondrial protein, partial [Mucuna pruriens]
MKEFAHKKSQGNHTLFIKHIATGGVTALLVYVVGIIITGNDRKEKEIGKLGCKPTATSIDPNNKLGEAQEELTIDKLDIAYLVNLINQFMYNPKESHLQVAYRVLHYLKGNLRKGIFFKRNNILALEAYTDADYARSLANRRSTSGCCTFLMGNLVTWRSKKHNVVARSSVEFEFKAIAQGLCELLWLKVILDGLRIKLKGPMKLYCDKLLEVCGGFGGVEVREKKVRRKMASLSFNMEDLSSKSKLTMEYMKKLEEKIEKLRGSLESED